MVTGSLFCVAAHGLALSPKQIVGQRVVPGLIFGAGAGLIGAGLFVTDPVAGYPPTSSDDDDESGPVAPTRAGTLHNLCAIPVFIGIPIAALICAASAARRADYRWASYSAGAAIAMTVATVLFGQAFDGAPRLARYGGLFQRVSITTGFGWLSALSLCALVSA
jgi:hypothetical protein